MKRLLCQQKTTSKAYKGSQAKRGCKKERRTLDQSVSHFKPKKQAEALVASLGSNEAAVPAEKEATKTAP